MAPVRGRLYVIAGPSGVGKGSVVSRLLDQDPALVRSISATTRPPRVSEVDGRDYFFVDDSGFESMVARGGLLEWAEVFGYRYGTPRDFVMDQTQEGRDVLLEIDVQGARQVKERVPEAVLVLLEPPSMDELGRRLRGRATESDEMIQLRLDEAARELAERPLFDHVVVNDELEGATRRVAAIIEASRLPSEETNP